MNSTARLELFFPSPSSRGVETKLGWLKLSRTLICCSLSRILTSRAFIWWEIAHAICLFVSIEPVKGIECRISSFASLERITKISLWYWSYSPLLLKSEFSTLHSFKAGKILSFMNKVALLRGFYLGFHTDGKIWGQNLLVNLSSRFARECKLILSQNFWAYSRYDENLKIHLKIYVFVRRRCQVMLLKDSGKFSRVTLTSSFKCFAEIQSLFQVQFSHFPSTLLFDLCSFRRITVVNHFRNADVVSKFI